MARWYENQKTVIRVVHFIAKRLNEGKSIEEIQEETKMPTCVIREVARSPLGPPPPSDETSVFRKGTAPKIFIPYVVESSGS